MELLALVFVSVLLWGLFCGHFTTNILRMVVAVLVLVVVVLVAAVYCCFLCFFPCLGRAVLASCNTVCTSSAKQPTIDRDGFKSLPYWLQTAAAGHMVSSIGERLRVSEGIFFEDFFCFLV